MGSLAKYRYVRDCLEVRWSSHTITLRSKESGNFTAPMTNKYAGDKAFSVVAPFYGVANYLQLKIPPANHFLKTFYFSDCFSLFSYV